MEIGEAAPYLAAERLAHHPRGQLRLLVEDDPPVLEAGRTILRARSTKHREEALLRTPVAVLPDPATSTIAGQVLRLGAESGPWFATNGSLTSSSIQSLGREGVGEDAPPPQAAVRRDNTRTDRQKSSHRLLAFAAQCEVMFSIVLATHSATATNPNGRRKRLSGHR
jgi:hypothetical protein